MYDAHGFLIEESTDTGKSSPYSRERPETDESTLCSTAWKDILGSEAPTEKLVSHIRAGIPPGLRGKIWLKLIDVEKTKNNNSGLRYQKLTCELNVARVDILTAEKMHNNRLINFALTGQRSDAHPPLEYTAESLPIDKKAVHQILLDIDRTFTTHMLFREKMGQGQQSLFNVLAAYCSIKPEMGYCQGQSYIAAVLLMHLSEEDAFWCFFTLMEEEKFMKNLFDPSLARVQAEALLFKSLLKNQSPKLSKHLEEQGVDPLMYFVQWSMCAFTTLENWNTVLHLWDTMLLQGMDVVHKMALSVMKLGEGTLISFPDLGKILPWLQHLPTEILKAIPDTVWKIDIAQLKSAKEDVSKKRQRNNTDSSASFQTPKKKKAKRFIGNAGSFDASHTTPSIFRRLIDNLSTPLRKRVAPNNLPRVNGTRRRALANLDNHNFDSPSKHAFASLKSDFADTPPGTPRTELCLL